jgi:hypothetical protein
MHEPGGAGQAAPTACHAVLSAAGTGVASWHQDMLPCCCSPGPGRVAAQLLAIHVVSIQANLVQGGLDQLGALHLLRSATLGFIGSGPTGKVGTGAVATWQAVAGANGQATCQAKPLPSPRTGSTALERQKLATAHHELLIRETVLLVLLAAALGLGGSLADAGCSIIVLP